MQYIDEMIFVPVLFVEHVDVDASFPTGFDTASIANTHRCWRVKSFVCTSLFGWTCDRWLRNQGTSLRFSPVARILM